ncbi:MAG: quinone-dependent dihydroorotate dehydrogenase [Alphaproteobacteria bacterium]|nr:quinone-dependent dihydroorotate dehydrogenase [Alphaproteobacteria bacterium]
MFGLDKVDLWKWVDKLGDPYPLIRPFLFMLDPEDAHELTLKMLGFGLGPHFFGPDDEILKSTVFGVTFPNPICLAAGLDKQATRIDAFMGFGFGSIEIGTVVPLPQIGNPRPRMFRVAGAKALINRFGMNSVGVKVFTEHLEAWHKKKGRTTNPLGINISKNKDTTDDVADYITCFEKVAAYAHYVTINISSPNTPGLRGLQERERMAEVLKGVTDARDRLAPNLPVLVKIAPDLTDEQQADIAAVVKESKIQGLVVSNTTLARPSTIPDDLAKEDGGLSGPPLFGPSTRLLSTMYKSTEGKIPLIGCGGVSSGEDAYLKIRAGASLVQVYTALIFEGPLVVQRIKRELAQCLRRDGFANVSEAIGADHKA